MSSNSVSTMPSSNNPKFEKDRIFDGDDKEGIYNQIKENIERDLQKLFPDAIKGNYSLLPNSGYSQQLTKIPISDSVTLKLLPTSQNQFTPNIIFRLKKKQDLTEDFDPDFWKYFYPIDEPFFNYDYGDSLQETRIESRNEENPDITEIYEGQVNENGERHGLGKLYTGNKILIGHWRQGQFTGWGREVDENGEIYEGKFVNGKLYGKGIHYDGKDYYLGDFRNKKMSGFGELFTDEFHYYGHLWDKVPDQKGNIDIYKKGSYEGQIKNGDISGSGVYKWNNGNYYVGEVHNGKMNGFGQLKHRNGKVDRGYFRDGNFVRIIDD